jgi:hypothetical protein
MEFHPKALKPVALCCVLTLAGTSSVQAQVAGLSAAVSRAGQTPGRPPLVSIVYPDTAEWFAYTPGGSAVAITAANPRAGRGSLELTKPAGDGSAFIDESRVFGTLGTLSSFSLDFFIDPASSSSLPPDVALLVYPAGDPRSFFLAWNGCSPTSCDSYPTGSWQSRDVVRSLLIQQAGSNPPPARLADVPADAPITGIHLRSSYSFGSPWHGFVDKVTLGFRGLPPTQFNFEVRDPALTVNTVSLALTNAHVDPVQNNQVVRAFVATGSKSPNCLVTLNETNNFAFGTVLFCGEREPANLGGVPGVMISVFFTAPVRSPDFFVSVTLYQQGATTYGAPVLCTAADGCS